MIARALEQKGIVSDRCELNRQIKADNALLRELKAAVKKLMQSVKNTVPAIADAMERLRSNMLIFKYQLLHIGSGKQAIRKSLNECREDMAMLLRQLQYPEDATAEIFKKQTALWRTD